MKRTTKKRSMRQLLMSIVAVVVMLLSMNMNSVFAEGTNVAKVGENEYATLAEAINSAADGSTIELLNNCKLDKNVSINKDLTIKSVEGKQFTVSLESKPVSNWGAIKVEGHNFTLSSVVLDGAKLNATAILGIDGATITLGKNCIVQNVDTTKNADVTEFNGAVRLNNMKSQNPSTLNMNDNAIIKDCKSAYGAACYVQNSNVVMTGNAGVDNCHAVYDKVSETNEQPGCGGAFRFLEDESNADKCTLTMQDNTFIKNCSASFDGGAYIFDNILGTATLGDDVVLEGNESQRAGGAIFIPRGTLNIKDDVTFEENSAERGGAIYAAGMNQNNNNDAHAKLNISGGTITNNSAEKYGAGVVINRYAEATLTGNPYIKENVDATGEDGKGNFYVAADPAQYSDTKLLIDVDDNSTMNVGIMGFNGEGELKYCSNAVNGQFTNRLPEALDDADEDMFDEYASKDFTGHVFNDANPNVYVEVMKMTIHEFWGGDGLYWRMNTVTYKDGCDGKAFETQVYHPGPDEDDAYFDGTPSRIGYKFNGWEETKESPEASKAYEITRTAKWEKVNTYTVTYKDGYSETPIKVITVNENDETPTVEDPVRDGYVFEGWDKDIADTVTGDVTYTAKWSEKKYTVTYKDGGDVLKTFKDVEKDSETPVIDDPVKDGYKFVGWTPEVAKTVTEDVTYTAKWEKLPEKFTVTYKDGYTDKPIKVFTVNENTKTPTVKDPVRDGYVFEGWDKTIADTVTGDVTYTAKWSEKKYTVTYMDGYTDKAIKQFTVKANDVTPTVDDPVRDGYVFEGWDKTIADTVTGDVTYTAKWSEKKYTVTYKDGDKVLQTSEVKKGSETPAIKNPTKDGYKFVGWTPEVAKTVTEDATYTAKWEKLPEKFTVTYKDGDNVLQTTEVEKDAITPTIDNPVKDGYTFVGWTPEIAKTVTEDATYTAKWEKLPEKFTVTYKDGDNVLQTTEVEKDAITPTIDNPVKDGYKFVGWTPEVAKTVTEDVTYTAKWEKVVVPNKEVKQPAKKNTPTTGDFGFVSGILPCALAGLGLVVWSKKH